MGFFKKLFGSAGQAGPPSQDPIQIEHVGSTAIVRFTCSQLLGETVESIGHELYRLAQAVPQPQIIVNLAGATVISSHMLGHLTGLRDQVAAARGRLVLCEIMPSLREPLQLLGLGGWCRICRDEQEALAYLAANEYFPQYQTCVNQGDYEQAVAICTEVIRLFPRTPWALMNRGTAHDWAGRPESAIADFTAVIQLEPDNPRAYSNRGDTYLATGNHQQAIADYTEAIRLDPANAERYRRRARAFEAAGDVEQAAADNQRAVELTRNPFGKPDVTNPDGDDVQAFAAQVDLPGSADDPNAEPWPRMPAIDDPESLDGQWDSRWNGGGQGEWADGEARLQCAGDRVYILFHDQSREYLFDLRRSGKDLVIGRYVNLGNSVDTGPWVGRIVGPERIDGQCLPPANVTSALGYGRWDFRRRFHVESARDYVQRAHRHESRGIAYYDQRQYDKAIADFTQGMQAESAWQYLFERGRAYCKNRQFQEAIADLTAALAGIEALKKSGVNEPWLTHILHATHVFRGQAYQAAKQPDLAEADYAAALGWKEGDADTYFHRGLFFREQGDDERAIADLTESIRLDPAPAAPYYNRGFCHTRRHELDLGIADFSQAIGIDPSDADHYGARGNAYFAKQDYDRAIADHTEAIRLNPKDAGSFTNRGTAHFLKGNHDQALQDHDQAIRLNPRLAVFYANRGAVHSANNNLDRAIADFTEAIRLEPRFFGAYWSRGSAYRKKQHYRQAIADLTEAVRLEPSHWLSYQERALAYRARGDEENAARDERRAQMRQ